MGLIGLLKVGTAGPDVRRWQTFLRGCGYPIRVDGEFGPWTARYTKRYQRKKRLKPDGLVGAQTLARALADGMGAVVEPVYALPAHPEGLTHLTAAARTRLFGAFEYRPAPTERNPERIVLTGDWQRNNVVRVKLPQLRRFVKVHRKVAESFLEVWQRWEAAGLLDRVLTWNGSFVPRFVRGSHTTLSNHSWATAFDLNARWNRLGHHPAPADQVGSVLELVPIANELGWFWGGHFKGRADGMHFEATKRAVR